jgi:hypothetical protein
MYPSQPWCSGSIIGDIALHEIRPSKAFSWMSTHRIVLFYLMAGFVPIASICGAYFDILPLYISFRLFVLPATAAAIVIAVRMPAIGRQMAFGVAAGMAATAVYDASRSLWIITGAMGDFIPSIGRLALHDPNASPVWGYAYRYLYDGGFMAMAFVAILALLRYRASWRLGLVFGVIICLCLFGTLLFSPLGERLAFRLTPATAAMALIGHVIYGSVLGGLLNRLGVPAPASRTAPPPRSRASMHTAAL